MLKPLTSLDMWLCRKLFFSPRKKKQRAWALAWQQQATGLFIVDVGPVKCFTAQLGLKNNGTSAQDYCQHCWNNVFKRMLNRLVCSRRRKIHYKMRTFKIFNCGNMVNVLVPELLSVFLGCVFFFFFLVCCCFFEPKIALFTFLYNNKTCGALRRVEVS